MAFLSFPNVIIRGVAACVPRFVEDNRITTLIPDDERGKLVKTTGIIQKRIASKDCCSSDLCLKAAEKLIDDLGWNKSEIEALVFVTQTPDYIVPATACILQNRLGLSKECLSFDVSLGCSGWVYGMNISSSMISNGSVKKALLLCGDTISRTQSFKDKTSYPLFGDAGTCTALEFKDNETGMKIHLATDGSGYDAILIPDGGFRNPTTEDSLKFVDYGEGKIMTKLHAKMDGMSVFSFAISKAPRSIKQLCAKFDIAFDSIDFFVFHQANLFLNETIRKKLKIDQCKVPYSMERYANSASATIPVTLVTQKQKELQSLKQKIIGCAFGVGLSWGSIYFETDHIVVPDLIEY